MEGLRGESAGQQEHSQPQTQLFMLRRVNNPTNNHLKLPNFEFTLMSNSTPLSQSSVPSFNNDHKPYTPAFIQQREKVELPKYDLSYKVHFEKEICKRQHNGAHTSRMASQDRSNRNTLFAPEPNTKYCSVCHEDFENYFNHIAHPIHAKKVEASIGKDYINDLVKYVQDRMERKRNPQSRNSSWRALECLSETSLSRERGEEDAKLSYASQPARKEHTRYKK